MKLKPGDKVSFINERRNGIVSRVQNENTVLVEIEEGFEVPVMVNELIKIADPAEKSIPKETKSESVAITPKPPQIQEPDQESLMPLNIVSDNTADDLLLYIVPTDDKPLGTGDYRLIFANNTGNDILFSCYIKSDGINKPLSYDAVGPNSSYELTVLSGETLGLAVGFLFHILFYNEDTSAGVIPPIESFVNFNPVKLHKSGAFKYSALLGMNAYEMTVHTLKTPEEWPDEEWDNSKINPIPKRDINALLSAVPLIAPLNKQYVIAPYIAEVDLHIEKISDFPQKLTNYEMLNMQLALFTRCLDAAIVHKFKKITFIHGVGQGRLKGEIIKTINESYQGVKIQDAPFKKFGFGATEVLIPFNLTL